MVRCAAIECGNGSREKKTYDVKGWHQVPTEDAENCLRQKWLTAMKRDPPYPDNPKDFVVCGLHFSDDDFKPDLKYEYTKRGKQRFILADNAIPSIFNFSTPTNKRHFSENRMSKRESKRVAMEAVASISNTHSTNEGAHVHYDPGPTEFSRYPSQLPGISTSEYDELVPLSPSSSMESLDVESATPGVSDISDVDGQLVSDDNIVADPFEKITSKYVIVDIEMLKPLLSRCFECNKLSKITKVITRGTMIKIDLRCEDHNSTWSSQFMRNRVYEGNLSVSAGIVLAGSTYETVRKMMEISGVKFSGKTSFYNIQKKLLFPAINYIYNERRRVILNTAKSGKVNLIGDGRYDSPGNNATFGTYTLMRSDNNRILDFFISHVRNAGNSQRMEAYAFTKVLNALIDVGITIASITTDRHKSIRKLLCEKYPDIMHQFDVWHFSKNISKTLHAKAKLKKYSSLMAWIRSIINHFWWSCATCGEDEEVLREKWISVLIHIADNMNGRVFPSITVVRMVS